MNLNFADRVNLKIKVPEQPPLSVVLSLSRDVDGNIAGVDLELSDKPEPESASHDVPQPLAAEQGDQANNSAGAAAAEQHTASATGAVELDPVTGQERPKAAEQV